MLSSKFCLVILIALGLSSPGLAKIIPFDGPPLSSGLKKKIETLRSLRVSSSEPLAKLDDSGFLYLVHFAKKGHQVAAALVLTHLERMYFWHFGCEEDKANPVDCRFESLGKKTGAGEVAFIPFLVKKSWFEHGHAFLDAEWGDWEGKVQYHLESIGEAGLVRADGVGFIPGMETGITQDLVNQVLWKAMGQLGKCFECASDTNTHSLQFSFWVGLDGRANHISVKDPRGLEPSAESCLGKAVGNLRFPKPVPPNFTEVRDFSIPISQADIPSRPNHCPADSRPSRSGRSK